MITEVYLLNTQILAKTTDRLLNQSLSFRTIGINNYLRHYKNLFIFSANVTASTDLNERTAQDGYLHSGIKYFIT